MIIIRIRKVETKSINKIRNKYFEKPACVLALDAAHSESKLAFCARSSAAKQIRVHAGLGRAFIPFGLTTF